MWPHFSLSTFNTVASDIRIPKLSSKLISDIILVNNNNIKMQQHCRNTLIIYNSECFLCNKDVADYKTKAEKLQLQMKSLRHEILKFDSEIEYKNSAIHALKEQIKLL
ncbi:hypothetical protein PV328_011109 [Microctonus aethiopoides]|uniref:Uncharacterized protein n=1 Tax=Microctonus aethiopoides TaxID=144406 RepID=A0AA39C3T3_9HYME|nr:hypothetical protein PV328_011109 [Microctonus aethiopoides]